MKMPNIHERFESLMQVENREKLHNAFAPPHHPSRHVEDRPPSGGERQAVAVRANADFTPPTGQEILAGKATSVALSQSPAGIDRIDSE